MASSSYSFIDVAVLDAVRERFAAGDALVILSEDLDQIIWANGPGASLFGYRDIESIIGEPSLLGPAARRQIMATSGFPAIGRDRSLMIRMTSGVNSSAMAFQASNLALPDGENAILLAIPEARTASRSEAEIARQALGGFNEPGHFVAFVDRQGIIEAASDGFDALGISTHTLADMINEVGADSDRIVKRVIAGGAAALPAGLARLTEARHLLMVIDEPQFFEDEEPTNFGETEPAKAIETPESSGEAADGRPAEPVLDRVAGDATSPPLAEEAVIQDNAHEPAAGRPAEAAPADRAASKAAAEPSGKGADAAVHHDNWYFSAAGAAAEPAAGQKPESAAQPPARITIDHTAAPVRFVWRTDADGKFSAVSPEFANAVGAPAADVVGRRFSDVASIFGLDPSGEIAGLLDRRDTWSGRSVLWPVAGTELKVPVDLAALPVYGRDRNFEGFRGFGVARTADAIVDPDGLGRVLTTPGDASAETPPPSAPPVSENPPDENPPAIDHDADPFKGEVPVLTIVRKPERRFSDKVIRLAEHRPPSPEKTLSTFERSAFREIGERLKKDGDAAVTALTAGNAPSQDETEAGIPVSAADTTPPTETAGSVDAETPSPVEGVVDTAADEPEFHFADIEGLAEPQPAKTIENIAEIVEDLTEDAEPVAAESESGQIEMPTDEQADRQPVDELPAVRAIDSTPAARDVSDAGGPVDDAMPDADAAGQTAKAIEETADPVGAAETAEAVAGEAASDVPQSAPESGAAVEQAADIVPDDEAALPEQAASEVVETKLDAVQKSPSDFEEARGDAEAPEDKRRAPTDTSILARLPVPVLIHSGDVLHYANDEFLDLTGYASVEQLGEAGGLDALFSDPYGDAPDGDDRSLRLRGAHGQEFPIDALLRSVPWDGGKALMLVVRRTGDDSDAFARSPDELQLKARVAEMRTIIDTATDGVVLITHDGLIRSISRPAEALFGFDSDEVGGKPFASLFAIESQRAARDYLNGLSDHGVASVLNDGREVIGREAQGRFIPLFMTIGKLPGDGGYCAVVRDITQWKRAEEDLTQARALAERASSQKSDFLARVSHEIRTPLNAIIGFSELMVDERFGPIANDRYRDYLRDINRSGNHVLELVNDLLDISKIEAGQQEMAYEAVSLNDTLAETVAMMQPQANRERVIIRSSFASKLPEVVADLRSIRQIALNILSNAVRYTQAGGQVIISTSYEPAGDVVMRVRDTGIGMSQAEIEQAMKPFKQINSLKRARADGTGLGLPLTKAMVEANRARFAINSTPGEGTLVEISFPSTRVLAD